jgi:hypothetical protein
MAKVIIHTNENGGVSVTVPTGEISIQAVQAKDTPNGSIIVDSDTLPNSDNDFFDAWELNGSTVSVNLSKAKEMTKKRLRAEREPLLQAQDILFQKALETNADTITIVAEKQRLRDITNQVDSATTTTQLRAMKAES